MQLSQHASTQPHHPSLRLNSYELSAQGHRVGRPVDTRILYELIDYVTDQFNIEAALDPSGLRVKSVRIGRTREFSVDGSDFLNSFFATDLAKVADAGSHGAAFTAYLNGPASRVDRVNLRARPDVVDRHVAPDRTPG